MSEFTEKEKTAYSNALLKLYDNLRIAKGSLLNTAVTNIGYTTEEIARDINNRTRRFELKTLNHEITNLNQYMLYDHLKRRAFIIMQSIDGADFEHGFTILHNKEISYDLY